MFPGSSFSLQIQITGNYIFGANLFENEPNIEPVISNWIKIIIEQGVGQSQARDSEILFARSIIYLNFSVREGLP